MHQSLSSPYLWVWRIPSVSYEISFRDATDSFGKFLRQLFTVVLSKWPGSSRVLVLNERLIRSTLTAVVEVWNSGQNLFPESRSEYHRISSETSRVINMEKLSQNCYKTMSLSFCDSHYNNVIDIHHGHYRHESIHCYMCQDDYSHWGGFLYHGIRKSYQANC